ncbi:phospholipase A2 inhibitor and Ly6/PLAUR domain-containing protein-like [Hemicordylus capensis]|uniref:phospholipase A2 inhibitor and Ly6/PLAUR domain-containing protein-like n=1 Tax=Hemicordylus capensis TaxID=884348 RepID=UPI002303290B|nr:phospholipase A2 inhibitor and Ly6/PLAUR domain-containing protein-like [Hemicordylus capensis]
MTHNGTMQASLIFFLFSILLATGVCLECEFCSSQTANCKGLSQLCTPSEDVCLTLTIETIVEDAVVIIATYKGCTRSVHCSRSPMTFTFPLKRKRRASKCCRKDLCNRGMVTLPKFGIRPNGLKCPGCISQDPSCPPTELIHCHGWEDHCVYYNVDVEQGGMIYSHVKRGCGTRNSCMHHSRVFGVPGKFMETYKKAQCTPAPRIHTKHRHSHKNRDSG